MLHTTAELSGSATESLPALAETPNAAAASEVDVSISQVAAAGTHPVVHISQQVMQLSLD
jgi:hypothetical protein